jgi:hypothetical protein
MHKALTRMCLLAAALGFAGAAQATNISGTISKTLIITTNSRLVGAVTCTVTGADCIQFGKSGITLNLNGQIMTGNGTQTSCTFNTNENGIDTNGFNNVSIFGPGIVRQFNGNGISVGGNNSSVNGVTLLSNCAQAIGVYGSQNQIAENSLALNGLAPPPNFFASIYLAAGSNVVLKNEVTGGVYGIFLGAASNNNGIFENVFSETVQGIGILILQGSSGNNVVQNQALGNSAIDIYDQNSAGTNTFKINLCETSSVGGTNICGLPNISGHQPPEQAGQQ